MPSRRGAERSQGQLQRGRGHSILMRSQQRESWRLSSSHTLDAAAPSAPPLKMHYGKKSTRYRGSEVSSDNLMPRCKHCSSICVALKSVGVWRGPSGKPWGHLRSHVLGAQGLSTDTGRWRHFGFAWFIPYRVLSLQMCLDQFLHFRWAIMKKKRQCGIKVGGLALTFRVVTNLIFLLF